MGNDTHLQGWLRCRTWPQLRLVLREVHHGCRLEQGCCHEDHHHENHLSDQVPLEGQVQFLEPLSIILDGKRQF